jgi:hypothetical protein
MIYGNPKILGGKYIVVKKRICSTHCMPTEADIASNTFTMYKGINKIQSHIVTPIPHDSFFMNIPEVTIQKMNNKSDQITHNNIETGSYWRWDNFHKYKQSDDRVRCSVAFLIFTFFNY